MLFSAMFYFAAVAALGKSAIGSELNNRIVNGTDAAVGQFPYVVSLTSSYNGEHRCGGAILTHRHVLTAAHCTTVSFDLVRVAVTTRSSDPRVYYNISDIYVHPEYDGRFYINDIAIVVVSSQIKFNELVQPISVETTQVGAGVVAVASGFGKLSNGESLSDRLQYLHVKTLDNAKCQERSASSVISDMICAWSKDKEGLCFGDSGGPLVANGKLIGVVSWAINPCEGGEPDIYTRVSSYVDWINYVIQ